MQAPLRILHLEDDAKDAELLLAMLEAAGIVFQVTRVDSQADFLASLEQGGCDLILADYSLPSFDGLSALKIALEKCPDVPFIFVSGTLGEEVAIEALKIGATDYVLKDRPSRIVPSVRRALREARERTERRRAEGALRESEERFRALVTASSDALYRMSADWSEMINLRGMDFISDTLQPNRNWLAEYIPQDEQPRVTAAIREAIRAKGVFELEHRVFLADGTIGWTSSRAVPMLDDVGEITEWFGAADDITERKRQEEELRQAQAARLETRVRERTRIARELHDTLLQSFQGLLLGFQSVLKMLPDRPLEARQRLESTLDQAAEAITDARVAIQGLRSLGAETSDLALVITAVGAELTAHRTDFNPPAIHVEVEGAPRDLNPIVRDEAHRIAGEALRNAFRHAQARRITVEIRYEERHFQLTVRDDGKGFDEDTIRRQAAGHFGLRGMRERAEIVGGRLEVCSKLDSGTQVELSIPGTIAYDGASHQSVTSGERPT